MSTIAYRNGILATDRQMVVGSRSTMIAAKHIIKDGWVYGGAGDTRDIARFIETAQGPFCEPFEMADDTSEILCISPNLEIWIADGGNAPDKIEGTYYALGAGGDVAMGALYMGASAGEAIRAAEMFDIYTSCGAFGEPVIVRHNGEEWSE